MRWRLQLKEYEIIHKQEKYIDVLRYPIRNVEMNEIHYNKEEQDDDSEKNKTIKKYIERETINLSASVTTGEHQGVMYTLKWIQLLCNLYGIIMDVENYILLPFCSLIPNVMTTN